LLIPLSSKKPRLKCEVDQDKRWRLAAAIPALPYSGVPEVPLGSVKLRSVHQRRHLQGKASNTGSDLLHVYHHSVADARLLELCASKTRFQPFRDEIKNWSLITIIGHVSGQFRFSLSGLKAKTSNKGQLPSLSLNSMFESRALRKPRELYLIGPMISGRGVGDNRTLRIVHPLAENTFDRNVCTVQPSPTTSTRSRKVLADKYEIVICSGI
jgi:hypothetical protein